MTGPIVLGTRAIGPGRPCYVIAEAGVNHNGDERTAHELVDLAASVGADAIKFQLFEPALVASDRAEATSYQRVATSSATQRELLEDLVLPRPAWADLARHADDAGLLFLCTPFDRVSADLLEALGVAAFKVPSGELDNLPFIENLAARGRPLLLSTGMGTLDEVRAAVGSAAAAPGVAVLHCVTAYPTPPDACNLRVLPALARELDVPVGWSDHTEGPVSAIAAVALGASLLERHLTVDRSLPGPDHAASADGAVFAAYVAAVRDTEQTLGDGEKRPVAAEEENRRLVRRSLHAAHDLQPGHRLHPDDVVALRPASGLPPSTHLEGAIVRRPIRHGQPITAADVSLPAGP